MKCWKCGVQKLSKEFPPWTIMETCQHAALHCLRCVTAHAEQHGSCSQCKSPVGLDSIRLKHCHSMLDAMFPEYKITYEPTLEADTAGEKGYISLAMLNGDSTSVELNAAMTVFTLRGIVKKELGVPFENQQLIYNGTEMKEYTEDQATTNLGYYKVIPSATIYVRRLLYAVQNSNLKKVVFDLNWGYPARGKDFLDATAIIFSGTELVDYLDYRKLSHDSMSHSGDVMDNYKKKGHHLITVNLQEVPDEFTHIFFTLSSYESPTISKFPNPSLKFYEKDRPDEMLCEDTVEKTNFSQAIVMCWISRDKGKWCVYSAGKASAGNSEDYEPLYKTISDIIANGL
ncbi:uncharacterized protein [Asterias amurensis]|uniref:uncharacterized protein n=1 Tax=Asterias amurensis TaxID=7602 RepID=UPI003AB69086